MAERSEPPQEVRLARLGALLDADGQPDADTVTYDNATSGLTGDTVRDAIDELADIVSSGSSNVQYGGLKPSTPTDDFDQGSLDVAWSARSHQGSFATTDCFTKALDGSHLSIGFNNKNGGLYRSTTNVDQTITASMHSTLPDATAYMMGIAVLNSSGTGVAILSYNDGNAYLGSITTWAYAGILQTITGYGHGSATGTSQAPAYMKLARTTNSWVGSISYDGVNWTNSSSGSTTITADRVFVGMFYDTAASYKGRLFVEFFHKV